MQLSQLDATAQAELVRTCAASSRELVDAAIARIEASNAELGAVIVPLYDRARADADAAAHLPPAPFRGVPILIKDITATVAGVPQCEGLLPVKKAGYVAPVDSYLVTALRKAGFVIVGKTNTS